METEQPVFYNVSHLKHFICQYHNLQYKIKQCLKCIICIKITPNEEKQYTLRQNMNERKDIHVKTMHAV
jgi:hypothetical protein